MMATIVAVNKNTKSARFISFSLLWLSSHPSYIHISALLLPFPKQFGKGTLMSRLSLSRANTILILILDKMLRTVRTVSRTKLSVPVYVGILLLQAPLGNEADVPLATVASAVIVVSHDHSPCCWLSLHPYIGFASPLSEAVWTTDNLVLYCQD